MPQGLEIVSNSAIRKPFARDCAGHASRRTLKVKRRLPRVIIFSKIILNFLIRPRGAQAPQSSKSVLGWRVIRHVIADGLLPAIRY
jgi:hypothetical protein